MEELSGGALLEALGAPAVVRDGTGAVLRANAEAGRLLDVAPEALAGRSGEEWEALLGERFERLEGGGLPAGVEAGTALLESIGYPRRVYARERREIPASGGPAAVLEIFRDVTGWRRAEAERERQEARRKRLLEVLEARVESAEKFKTELTHNVSHDLRTPLASIKAAVSGLLAGDVAYGATDLRETLTLVEEETDRLQRRVQNLLSMARMEAGDAIQNRDWVDIPDIVASALEALRSLRGDRPTRLEMPEDLPLVLADYDQIQIALRNLIENAFLYSPPGSPVEVSASVGLGQLRVRVRDFGPGLMPDEFERVFDKFYRGRAARRIPGTGLGLPICRGIAEAHGGRLWAEHVPGGGVAFVLSLPLDESPPELESAEG